ncbi:hypothetical protein BS50DRAFT_197797 [Corynespora cassiicola Philippines]|uniref:Uncharacterized protein n=1 Tax=Corynespora cassiicola Philippines TaxID=1448308 RepID=A0A2T2N5U1_CORCC|nr:hypothetical protein BS50DRAFT_197797 [Corynespora cassiicola Philippines]
MDRVECWDVPGQDWAEDGEWRAGASDVAMTTVSHTQHRGLCPGGGCLEHSTCRLRAGCVIVCKGRCVCRLCLWMRVICANGVGGGDGVARWDWMGRRLGRMGLGWWERGCRRGVSGDAIMGANMLDGLGSKGLCFFFSALRWRVRSREKRKEKTRTVPFIVRSSTAQFGPNHPSLLLCVCAPAPTPSPER